MYGKLPSIDGWSPLWGKQVAMFLGTMELPSDGETLQLGDQALACCREQLCPKFQTEKDCAWIASGDLSWKEKLSDDLDRVQVKAVSC
jgi:hypothetical protein